jgi:hypothetical protein
MKKRLKNMGRAGGEERTRIFKRFLKETGLYSLYVRDRLHVKIACKADKLKVFSPCVNYGTPYDVLYNSFPITTDHNFHQKFWKYVRGVMYLPYGQSLEFENLLDEYVINNVRNNVPDFFYWYKNG